MVYNQGKQAAKLGDDKFVKRQAAKYLALQDKSKRSQRMLLLMEEARLQREMVKISGDLSLLPGISANPSRRDRI